MISPDKVMTKEMKYLISIGLPVIDGFDPIAFYANKSVHLENILKGYVTQETESLRKENDELRKECQKWKDLYYAEGVRADKLSCKLNKDIPEFGIHMGYNKGDILVWKGQVPCIGRIIRGNGRYFNISKTHNSLHYMHLRPATPYEIELLGTSDIRMITEEQALTGNYE